MRNAPLNMTLPTQTILRCYTRQPPPTWEHCSSAYCVRKLKIQMVAIGKTDSPKIG